MLKQVDFSIAYASVHLPAKVTMATTMKPDGSYNLITLEWFMRTSIQPAMFAISIGNTRYSYECISQYRFFNLVFPSTDQHELCMMAGTQSGRDIDKLAFGKVATIPGKTNKLPILTDAVVNLECNVVSQILSGDHTIFIGQVNHAWFNDEKELYYFHQK